MTIFETIVACFAENDMRLKIEETVPEFLDSGWEDDFEDEYEAYAETGRGEAETQVLEELIAEYQKGSLSSADYCDLFNKLKEHYGLTV